jgi:hypothetical protein
MDVQNDDNVIVKDYVHRHVLRDVVSRPTGDPITEPLLAGAVISKTFRVSLSEKWEAKHCSVVAYVHRGGDPVKDVLQAVEEHVE